MVSFKKSKGKKEEKKVSVQPDKVEKKIQKGHNEQKVSDTKKKKQKIKKSRGDRSKTKTIVVAVVNLLGVLAVFVLLGRLQSKAAELKRLKNALLAAEQSSEVNFVDLELKSTKDIADKLLVLYPDEIGLVDFVKEIEKIQEEEVLIDFSFANQKPVNDKTGYVGIPVAIQLEGTWEQIGDVFEKFAKLSYLFRPVTINARPKEEGLVNVKFGGFLYVDESMGKN